MRNHLIGIALVALTLAPVWAQQQQKPENKGWEELLPTGPGRETVLTACVTCHGIKAVVNGRKDRAGWQKAVDDMIQRGAPVFPEEIDPLTAYLAHAFPVGKPKLVNVNTASVEALAALPGVTTELAKRLVDARTRAGSFTGIEQVRQLGRLNESEFEAVRYLLKFSE